MEFDITSTIVTYRNNLGALQKTISSFLNTELKVKLYVVDNSPTDEIQELCKDKRIKYIFNNANVGFGAGHNIAIKKSLNLSKYHLVLNPDIYFEKGELEEIYGFMELNDDIGGVMPRVLYPDGSIQHLCKLLPTPCDLIFRRFLPFKSLKEKRNNFYELQFTGYDKVMDVPCLSGCFMFIRTEALKKVGLFDERFFMYLEDTDLSRRIHKYYRTVYYPKAVVYHRYEKGSYKNLKLLKYHIESAIKYFNKWGWFFDKERNLTNRRTLESLKIKGKEIAVKETKRG